MRGMLAGMALVMGGGAYAWHNHNAGENYSVPFTQAHDELASMSWPERFTMGNGSSIMTVSDKPDQVSWVISNGGHEMGTAAARLTALGPNGTNVKVSFDATRSLPNDGGQAAKVQPLVEHIAESVIEEQVGATLEHRPFNERRVGMEIAGTVAANRGALSEYMSGMSEMAERSASWDDSRWRDYESQSHVARSTAAEAYSGHSGVSVSARPMTNARPMTDLSNYR